MNSNPGNENQLHSEAVLQHHSQFSAHMLSGDLEGIVALLDEAVVDMAPGGPSI